MDKTELKRLSKKYFGAESKYVKLMEKGVRVEEKGEDGSNFFRMKRYSKEEIEALFQDLEKKDAELKEQERLKSLAKSVRSLTGISS